MTDLKRFWVETPWWGLLFLAAGWVFILAPVCTGGFVPGNAGDSRFNLYLLEHFYECLAGQGESLMNAPFFFPWPTTIGFSDTHWITGLIYAVLRAAGMDGMDAFAAWFAIGNLLNFLVAYCVFRKFGLGDPGAAVAAFLYAFSLPVTFQFTHVQLAYRMGVPPALYFLQRYLASRNPVAGALMVFFIALQAACTFYIGIFSLLLVAGWTLGWGILQIKDRVGIASAVKGLLPDISESRRNGMAVVIIVIALMTLIMAILPNIEAAKAYGFKRAWGEIRDGLPSIKSYFLAFHSHIWWRDESSIPSLPLWWEQNLFPGLLIMLGVGASFRGGGLPQRGILFLARTSLLFLVVTTISLCGISLYFLVSKLPGFDAIRSVSRIILVSLFPAAFLAGSLIESLWSSKKNLLHARLAVVILCAFTVYEAADIIQIRDIKNHWIDRLEALRQQNPILKGSVSGRSILVITRSKESQNNWDEFESELDAMLLSQQLGIRTLNGYSGNLPGGWRKICSAEDILNNISTAQAFRKKHGYPEIPIGAGDLMVIGSAPVDRGALAREMGKWFPASAGSSQEN
jgi:hypothetical protein